ncbi:MAG TPA: hypothetical protein VMD59_07550, partial [Acidimicrobiales bacterium]|nr:hypothetical protein [Acidimicrobiales bacterium]
MAVSVAVVQGTSSVTEYAVWEGANGNLWYATNTGGTWTGPTSPGYGPMGSEPSAVAVGSDVYVFWEGTNSALWWAEYNGTSWSASASSPGDGPLGSPPSATYNTKTLAIDIFWKGSDGNLWGATYTPTTTTWT